MPRNKTIGLLLILGAVTAAAAGLILLRSSAPPSLTDSPRAIDVLVAEESIYTVSLADLRPFGWGDVDPRDLRLEYRGAPYSFYLETRGREFSIVFYGQAPGPEETRYTAENVYRLYRDGDAALTLRTDPVSASGLEAGADGLVRISSRLEENLLYAPKFLEGKPWFWQQIVAPGEANFMFDPAAAPVGPARLMISVYGTTESADFDPDHHLLISVNGVQSADIAWDGAGPRVIEIDLPAGVLSAGENEIRMDAPGDTGVAADILLLDWIAVDYSADPQDLGDLEFPIPFTVDAGPVRMQGSDGNPVYVFEFGADESMTLHRLTGDAVLGMSPGSRGIAGNATGLSAPAGFRVVSAHDDLRAVSGAQYIAIGAPELLAPLEPLLAYRQEEGIPSLAVPLEAVYDQFGDGIRSPEALRDFLRFAYTQWDIAPDYVLLVGDWSYDTHGYTTPMPAYALPSFFVHTEYGGETASDVEFVQLDGDGYPDLAIGRFPARTSEQVTILVEKTLAFESLSAPGWRRSVVAVADGSEPGFATDAAAFLNAFSGDYLTHQITQDGDGRATTSALIETVNEGALVLSYFGHGSIVQWGKDELFTSEDAAGLANGERTPIVVNITCLAGLFTHPTVESMTEVLLWNNSGGAVAGLAATSLTLPVYQAYLSAAFVAALIEEPGLRLGEMLLRAQQQVPLELSAGAGEVLDTFLLFGDPALLLPDG